MTKRLFLLSGLAILAVVASHAAGWGFVAMFYWTDRYLPVPVPNYDQVGSAAYYVLSAIRSWGAFAVPAFLFVSGFFVAYAARGGQGVLSWKVVGTRLRALLIPYLIWSIVIYLGDALQGHIYPAGEYLLRLVVGGAHPSYFFVPLLCQFYLLSPFVVPIARERPAQLLAAAGGLQLAVVAVRQIELLGIEAPALHMATDLLFPMYGFYFALGLVFGFHMTGCKRWLVENRRLLAFSTLLLAVASVAVVEVAYQLTGVRRGAGPNTIVASLFSAAFILAFLAFGDVKIPFSRPIHELGRTSYGIYLLHAPLLELAARSIQEFTPGLLAYQVILQIALTCIAIAIVLAFMRAVARTPARRSYRYLFG